MAIRHKAIALCFFAMFLSGCSSNYVIATKEGQMLLTKNKPALDKDTGLLSYLDEDGHGQWRQINNEVVSQIVQR
ncbi:MAG: YgdI/YgdR family lipoprotein [Symbiopectobacterium sp.]|uniref:YgdI/YgdR family lipoprotein n=1 Tax=Symbiopectobacterium sp. TaxID=2952789 RepID=UPI003F2F626D